MPTKPTKSTQPLDVEEAVRRRYSNAAGARESALCCPVEYDRRYLEILPPEIVEKDYGCGDPSRHAKRGETVLDLGCGGGKSCYIAAQVVGPEGSVIGVDFNDDMLELAERYRTEIGDRLGYHNVSFRKGKIQRLNRLVPPTSIDLVISNCVLNLVERGDRGTLFAGIHEVLRSGGRAVISDIVCDRDVPRRLREDPELWSGCISGAFREDRFLAAFEDAGFARVENLERDATPWRVVEGIEFRSVTVRALKDTEPVASGCC